MPGITLRVKSLRAAGLRGNAGHALPSLAVQLGRLDERVPGLATALLGLLDHAVAVLVLQHLLILLQQILGHVEHRASPAAVTVAAPPLVLRLLLRAAVLDVELHVVLGVVLGAILLLLDYAGPTGILEEAGQPPGLEILQDAVPASLGVPQNRHVLALLPDAAEDPRQRRLLLHHRRDGVGRGVLGGRMTVLRLADVHLGGIHANRNGHVARVHDQRFTVAYCASQKAPSRYLISRSREGSARVQIKYLLADVYTEESVVKDRCFSVDTANVGLTSHTSKAVRDRTISSAKSLMSY